MKKCNKALKKISKKNIILISLATSISLVPIIVGTSQIVFNNQNNKSQIANQIRAIKNNSQKIERKIETSANWTIEYKGTKKTFSTPEEIRNFINTKIINPSEENWTSIISDLSPYTNLMGELDIEKVLAKDSTFNVVNKQTFVEKNNTTQIYRGNNDKAYTNEEDAKNSFNLYGEAYLFNDIYFTNKEDLKNYLLNEYLPNNKTQHNTIVLTGPNGVHSSPINVSSKNATNEINRFIKNNATKTLNYKNTINGETYSINKYNMESNLQNVNLKDLNYLHVQSNQGESRYIIDNKDSANLIGPYFYKGNLDVGAFLNKNMWRKTTNISKSVYVESKVDALIGSFFSSILNDDASLTLREAADEGKIPLLFRTLITKVNEKAIYDEKKGEWVNEEIPLDEWFLIELRRLSPALYNDVILNNLNLMSGNKYNAFYKLPTLYNFLLQRIVTWGLGQQVLDLVNYYFGEVADFIQDVLEVVIDQKSLFEKKNASNKIEYFDVKTFFQIGNPEYDFNTSIEYFLNEIKSYTKLIGAMHAYNSAYTNLFLTGGMIPFESVDVSALIENGIMTRIEYEKNSPYYKNIYLTFSQTGLQEMVENYVQCSSTPEIVKISSMDKSRWLTEFEKLNGRKSGVPYVVIFQGIGLKNTEYHDLARSYINAEIRIFNETNRIFNDGYLEQLYHPNHSLDSLSNFIMYMNSNPNEDAYKVYMAYLFDHKINGINLLQGNNIVTDKTQFGLTVAKLVTYIFGSATIVGTTINGVYNNGYNVRNSNHPIAKLNNPNYDKTTWVDEKVSNNNIQQRSASFNKGARTKLINKIVYDISTCTRLVLTKINKPQITAGFCGLVWFGNGPVVTKNPSTGESSVVINSPLFEQRPQIENKPDNNTNTNGNNPSRPTTPSGNVQQEQMIESHRNWNTGDMSSNSPTSILEGVAVGTVSEEMANLEVNGRRVSVGEAIININDPIAEASDAGYKKYLDLTRKAGYDQRIVREIGEDGVYRYREWYAEWILKEFNTDITDTPNFKGLAPNLTMEEINNLTPETNNNGSSTPPPSSNIKDTGDRLDSNTLSDKNKKESKKWWQFKKPTSNPIDINIEITRMEIKRRKSAVDWSGRSAFIKVKDAFSVATDFIGDFILPAIGTAIGVLEIVTLFIDLFQVNHIKEFYVYTTADGTNFIWDGGLTISKYLGFDVKQVKGIESMELVTPIQITLPQLEEFYYFNSVKYYDSHQLKRESLKYMLENDFSNVVNQNFSIKYSLSNLSEIIDGADSIELLTKQVFANIGITSNADGSLDISKINKDSVYLSKLAYAFDGGIIASDASKYAAIRDNIVSNIRKTSIIQMPKLDGQNNAISNGPFILAGNVYKDGKVTVVQSEHQYIIDNSANLLKQGNSPTIGNFQPTNYLIEDINLAESNSKNNIIKQFNNTVKVAKKTGVISDVNNNKPYSEISSNIYNHKIYNVKLDNNSNSIRFTNIADASRYILSKLKFSKNAEYKTVYYYRYRNMEFYNDEQIESFIKENNIF